MSVKTEFEKIQDCPDSFVLAINDTVNVINGKWKLPIIASLSFGKKRFSELEKEISKINPRMLSKELRDLEANGIVVRKVYDTIPVSVEYELTVSGQSFKEVMTTMLLWGLKHRERMVGKKK